MWYVSGTEWTETSDGPRHRYLIKYAESRDGLRWERTGIVCHRLPLGGGVRLRPTVCPTRWQVSTACGIRIAVSSYRIGYAESADGIVWTRQDSTSVVPASSSGWDSEMTTYPWSSGAGIACHMLYNGNGYGRTGIGLAVGT